MKKTGLKKPLIERFQKLAGIKPLYELSPELMARAAEKAAEKGGEKGFSQTITFDKGVLDKLASDLEGKTMSGGNLKVDSIDVDHPKELEGKDEEGEWNWNADSKITIHVSVPTERVGGIFGIGGSDEYTGGYAPSRATDAEIEKGVTQYGETLEDYNGVTMTKSQAISSGIINKDPETGEETAGRYRYNENTQQLERTDLSFKEHWDNAPKAIRWSPTLRFLYSSGKNLGEWAKNKGWNYNSNTGNFTDNSGGNVGERQLMNAAAPEAPGLVSGQSNTQTTTGYSASQWYANLGNTNTTGSNPFSFSTAFADAKAKQQTILGNPSAIKQLAVNESPFYGFLKENSLDKGIL